MSAVTTKADTALLERVLVGGNLAALSPQDRLAYYRAVCESLGLNPLTLPFEYLQLQGRLVLYARRDATDQLRRIHGISIEIVSRDEIGGIYVVTARARSRDGRVDESIGAVPIAGLSGEALAIALMKAETRAKRRVTLSICGLGLLDESEVRGAAAQDGATAPPDNAATAPEALLPPYPEARFAAQLPKWAELVASGRKTVDEILATVASKYALTDEQRAAIEALAPDTNAPRPDPEDET